MKNSHIKKWSWGVLTLLIAALGVLSSCNEKNGDTGTPVILSVYKLDTILRHKDSTFSAAEPNVLLVIHGQNIGGVTHAYFNEYLTSFNTNYNSNTDLIITVPAGAPTDSTADNMIRLVTSHGTATYAFKIIAKPVITSSDKVIYGSDRGDITFVGKNFADMTGVVAFRVKDFATEKVKDSIVCEIISKSPTKLVVRIPADTLSRVTLNFTNSSGTTYYSTWFINADVAMKIFTDDYGDISNSDGTGKVGGDSWANPQIVNSDQAYGGTKSFSVKLNSGGWSWFGFDAWWPPLHIDTLKYNYITFAIKGGDDDFPLWISSQNSLGGNGSFPDAALYPKNQFNVTAKIWNPYILKISDLDFFKKGANTSARHIIQQFGFRPQGPTKDETIYVDDVMFIK